MLAPVFLKNLISSKIFKNDKDKNTIVTVIIFFKYEYIIFADRF